MAANAEPIYDVTSTDPGTTNASGPEAANPPKYSLAAAGANDDTHMATAGYVKGAYNAAIKAVNKVAATAADAANKDLSNLSDTGRGVITTAITNNAAGATYSNTTSGLTASTIQGAIDEIAGTAGNAANKDLSNLSNTGKANVSAQGTYDSNATYTPGTVGAAIKGKADAATTLAGYGITDAYTTTQVDTAIEGSANTATYSSATNYDTGTVGAAIKSLQTSGATQTGVENTIETADITANVPTLTVWGNDNSVGTADVVVTSIAATYAEPTSEP